MRVNARSIVGSLAVMFLAGCGAIPVKSEKIEQTDIFVSEEAARALVTAGTSREEILTSYGEPDVRGWQDGAFGYLRCATFNGNEWSLVFLIPIPTFGNEDRITDCEYLGFWFDERGQLVKADTKVIHNLMLHDTGSAGLDYYMDDLKDWMAKHAPQRN